MTLIWMTDTHFDSVTEDKIKSVAENVSGYVDNISGVLITGDISSGIAFDYHLKIFQEYLNLPIYFVLGNHDYYYSDFKSIEIKTQNLHSKNLHWLTNSPIDINDYTLCGIDNFYDANYGNLNTDILLNDFVMIKDFLNSNGTDKTKREIISVCKNYSKYKANILKEQLNNIVNDNIIIALHVSPYEGSCWHHGKISDRDFLPWFTSKESGNVIDEYAKNNLHKTITVLCGHSHSRGYYKRSSNLDVFTGFAQYMYPTIAGTITNINEINLL